MSALSPQGLVSYNGFTFPVETETLGVRITPVPDATGRTVKYTTFGITLRTILVGTTTDSNVLAARRLLTKFGAAFRYEDKGLGGLTINVGTAKDVVWGPKPQELSFKPIAGKNACELVWRVDVAIPDCADAQFDGQPMELAYTVTFAVDYAGYTTRTITGHVQVPVHRMGKDGVYLTDSVDRYRETIVFPLLYGPWKRTFGPWVISPDRTRLDFSVIDTEQGVNAPPPWVVDIKASHSVSTMNRGFGMWVTTISAEYELAKDAPDSLWPLKHFLTVLVKQRKDAAVPPGTGQLSPPLPTIGLGAVAGGAALSPLPPPPPIPFPVDPGGKPEEMPKDVIPISFAMNEPEIYGRRKASFSISFSHSCGLKQILRYNGLWRPVGGDWSVWSASLAGSAFHPRGYARLEFRADEDQITSLCRAPSTSLVGTRQPQRFPGDGRGIGELIGSAFPAPTKDLSWIHYEQEIYIETDSGAVPIRLLPDAALTGKDDVFGSSPDVAGRLTPDAMAGIEAAASPYIPGASQSRLENNITEQATRRVKPQVVLYLRGKAVRANFQIPAPRLTNIEGIRPIPANRADRGEGFTQKAAFAGPAYPIWRASWNLRYFLPELPKNPIPLPPNPLLGGQNNPQEETTR